MDYMIRAIDEFGRVTTKLYDTESEFLDRLEWFLNSGLKVEAFVRKETWEKYVIEGTQGGPE